MIKFLLAFISRFLILCFVLIALAVVIGRVILHPDIIAYIGAQHYVAELNLVDLSPSLTFKLPRVVPELSYIAWSPDGNSIAFNSRHGRLVDIYRISMIGGELVRLTTTSSDKETPFILDWTPEGILVMAQSQTFLPPSYTIYMMDADGHYLRTILSDWASDTNPVWSPDRSQIAFLSNRDMPGDPPRIYLLNITDGAILPVNCDDLEPSGRFTWSPDGKRLAVSAYADSGSQIFICDLTTGHSDQLTNQYGSNFTPVWSPDGEQIAFISDTNLYSIHPDGSHLKLIAHDVIYFPSWRP